jgi:signal transduction histidine kinase
LLAGFGGVLVLMLFAGLDSARVIGRIHTREQEIRREYQNRNRVLNQIRSDLYLSGTYVRDYLLDPEAAGAEAHRTGLEATRECMESALASYGQILTTSEQQPFRGLRRELDGYWRVLDPVFRWTTEQRRERGYLFLRDEVFPRRMAMLDVASQIAGINENLLTAGEESVEELFSGFRRRLLFTILITMGLGLLLAAFSVRQILNLEEQAAVRYQEIAEARRELKNLSASLVAAQENERRSISRELHDEIGQSLSAVLVELSNLSAAVPGESVPGVRRHADTIRSLVEGSVAEVRNLSLLLRPSMLDDLGLVPALEWQARETSRRTGMRVSVAAENVPDDLPETHKTCVYRVVQEALHNCARHAQAHKVRITVRQDEKQLFLSVHDDGKGFDAKREKGLGLLGMEERVGNLSGSFRIDSEPGNGSTIAVALPFVRKEES